MTEKSIEDVVFKEKSKKDDKSQKILELFNFDAPKTFKESKTFKQNPDILMFFGVKDQNINNACGPRPSAVETSLNSLKINTINSKLCNQASKLPNSKSVSSETNLLNKPVEKQKSKRTLKSFAISAGVDSGSNNNDIRANDQKKLPAKLTVIRPIKNSNSDKVDNKIYNKILQRSKSVKDREIQKEKTMSYLYCPIMHEYSLIKLVSIIYLI